MATVSEVLSKAKSQIGVCEDPAGSNLVKYNRWYYGKNVSASWCMIFVQWIADQCGFQILRTTGCTEVLKWSKKINRFYTSGFKPGDIVLFDWDHSGDADHVGIIEKVYSGYVRTIEGNTSETNRDNGGKVMRRTRYFNDIAGVYRPYYEISWRECDTVKINMPVLVSNVKGVPVKSVQRQLRELGYTDAAGKKLKVSAVYDAKTIQAVKKFQRKRKIEVDGIFGEQSWKELMFGTH